MKYKTLFWLSIFFIIIVSIVGIGTNFKKEEKIKILTDEIGNLEAESSKKLIKIIELQDNISELEDKLSKVRHFDDNLLINEDGLKVGTSFTGSVYETQIDGEFDGWDGETIFKMTDGSIWQQSSYAYTYHYAYRPDVIIFSEGGQTYMKVEGVNDQIAIRKLR